jgi:hypothetical protein
MRRTIKVSDVSTFCIAFGATGLGGWPRTGSGKRTHDDKEWFVVRHYLKSNVARWNFLTPLSIQKGSPPEPDFVLKFDSTDIVALLEVTEATDPADQREMTMFEFSKKPAMLLGEFGGRFHGGASQPGPVWVSDVLNAITRKVGKAIYSRSHANRHLIIYPNSNASTLLADDKDERDAFRLLKEAVELKRDSYIQTVNGCSVHVLSGEYVCFDLLGRAELLARK